MKTMDDFREHPVQDLYDAEQQAPETMFQPDQRAQHEQLHPTPDAQPGETEQSSKRLQAADYDASDPTPPPLFASPELIEEWTRDRVV